MSAELILDKDFALSKVDPRLFSGFMEHLGDVIYGTVYDPRHPMADEDGFRSDILELVRKLRPALVRYPGGNFVSAYNWEDGVGPREARVPRQDVAWKQTDPNTIGVHEFARWTEKAGANLMMAVNLGTRGIDAARDLVEYMNHPGGSRFSDMRIRNGRRDPFGVKLWCLGNEMDGPWQVGRKTAEEYGRIACEAGKIMKFVDPSIELVACGSSFSSMPTFGHWEDTVLSHCLDEVDYVSLHSYYGNHLDSIGDFLAQSLDMGLFIDKMAALADAAAAKKKSKKRLNFSFDEWNMWSQPSLAWPGKENEPRHGEDGAPEFDYRVDDALMVALMLMELMNHADRVKISCFTMLTGCIESREAGPDGRAFAKSIYYPFLEASLFGRGEVLRHALKCERYSSRYYDDVPVLAASTVLGESGSVSAFVVNRAESAQPLAFRLRGFPGMRCTGHEVLESPDRRARNTGADPARVSMRPGPGAAAQPDGSLMAEVAPLSFNVYHFGA